jgi:biopolymer transport protein ExbB/TolQ
MLMFCCALGALGGKMWLQRREKTAFLHKLLPAWDGRPLPPAHALAALDLLQKLPRSVRQTWLARRVLLVLEFLKNRNSARELDDQLRALADNDALALESSYALTRFITWAIPILGFLGTVLGITGAISGVTPEVLEKSLSTVTDGLALAFDTTALGLALTMITMFLSFLVERAEQGTLEAVDTFVDRHLAHRFERNEAWPGDVGLARQVSDIMSRHAASLSAAVEVALERTLQAHAHRMGELEKQGIEQGARALERVAVQASAVCESGRQQQAALAQVIQGVSQQAQTLLRFQEMEKELLRLQHALHQNLAALAGAGAFEQAVHSLTAAIHLLTTRAAASSPPFSEKGRSAA